MNRKQLITVVNGDSIHTVNQEYNVRIIY